jgi:sialate O-acetylesterase
MKNLKYYLFCNIFIFLVTVLLFPLYANVTLPKIFASNMVLQQNREVNFWGWADPGEEVTVTGSWNGEPVMTASDENGKWSLELQTPVATTDCNSYSVTISGNNTITLTEVLVGEVWLLSGQSNMDMPLNGWPDADPPCPVEGGEEAIATANYPDIRLIIIGWKASATPQDDFKDNWINATWTACTPASARWFSAIGYFFGRDLFENLSIPVGLIACAWGGSPCEAWTSAEALEYVPDFQGQGPWIPENENDNWTPTGLYNGMIAPLIPFTIAGALWYQGESNYWQARQLTELFPAMIHGWRKDWQQGDFPFYFVQLAPWGGYGGLLPEFWEAQASVLPLENTGMVVTLDVGNFDNVHPEKKEPVGQRLALWAKARLYGYEDVVYSGPVYSSMQVEDDRIRLSFDYAESGLKAGYDSLKLFEIAGADEMYYRASAQIEGNEVIVRSDNVPEPVNVRYAWLDTATASLYNNADLPAAPFRTRLPDYFSPVRVTFQTSHKIIKAGESCTLLWMTIGASSITLNGEGVNSFGSVQVSPDSNTYYTLVASGEITVEKNIEISVVPQNLINWAINQPVTVSSIQEEDYNPDNAVDGDEKSRWSSGFSDPQWICIDLGEAVTIARVILLWETAYGKSYEIQVSDDLAGWTTIFNEDSGDGGMDDLMNLSGTGRYIRLYGTERGTEWGYSLWELAAYSTAIKTNINIGNAPISGKYKLMGNYPNPFNLITTIQFYLEKSGVIELKIYSVTGQLIKTIKRRYQTAGEHELKWNAEGLPSGIYFYRIKAGEFSATKKLILLK